MRGNPIIDSVFATAIWLIFGTAIVAGYATPEMKEDWAATGSAHPAIQPIVVRLDYE